MVKVIDPEASRQDQMKKAVEAVNTKRMSIRKAAASFGVDKSSLHRRTTRQVPLNARPGPNPILTEGEVQGVLDAVDARTNRGQCFTTPELGMFIRDVVERSPYTREIPETSPSTSWVNGFIRRNKAAFSRRSAQTLSDCRAKASTEENVERHYLNLRQAIEVCGNLPPSRIWNLDETGMCAQGSGKKPTVLATIGKRANIQKSDSRVNVSALVCANADGGIVPPFIIFPGKNVLNSHTIGGFPKSKYASSRSSYLVTSLFVQYFEWFVTHIPPDRPVLLIMDGYKAHFSVRTLACARRNDIHLYALPAHTSHFLQPMDVSVFNHFKQNLGKQIEHFQKTKQILVDETNIVAVAAPAFQEALTRAHIVNVFEKTGIYPLSRSKMMAGLIGDKPARGKKDMILLKPTVFISGRTTRKIERAGDSVDRVRVASANHWMMEERSLYKKAKRDHDEEYVNGACLMTSDEIFERSVAKAAEKQAKLQEKEQRTLDRMAKAKGRERKKIDNLVAAEIRKRDKIAAARAAEEKRTEVTQAKEAKRIAAAQAREEKRFAVERRRVANAEAKEVRLAAKAKAKEEKRIATLEKNAAAAQAKLERRAAAAQEREVKRVADARTKADRCSGTVGAKRGATKRQRTEPPSIQTTDLPLKFPTYFER